MLEIVANWLQNSACAWRTALDRFQPNICWFQRRWALHGGQRWLPGRLLSPSGRFQGQFGIPKPPFPHGVCGQTGVGRCGFHIGIPKGNAVQASKITIGGLGSYRLFANEHFGCRRWCLLMNGRVLGEHSGDMWRLSLFLPL